MADVDPRAPSQDGRPLLEGLRIIEVGQVLAGPYAGMLLADLGADVIKVEPRTGDISRHVGAPGAVGESPYFASLNRNKRSVVVDLATDQGREQLGQLVATADALIVNMKASTIRKLGLTYDALRRWNERLVCVAITGYGLDGSHDDRPAFDYIIQAETGVAAMTGEPGSPPGLAGYSVVDNSVGMLAALGTLAAIVRGQGGQVDVSMHDATLSQLNYKAATVLNGGAEPVRLPSGSHSFYAPAQLCETADGHLAVFVTHDDFWNGWRSSCAAPTSRRTRGSRRWRIAPFIAKSSRRCWRRSGASGPHRSGSSDWRRWGSRWGQSRRWARRSRATSSPSARWS